MITFSKASPCPEEIVPDLQISISADLPEFSSTTLSRSFYRAEASRLVEALRKSLPAATIDAILLELLEARVSLLQVTYGEPSVPFEREARVREILGAHRSEETDAAAASFMAAYEGDGCMSKRCAERYEEDDAKIETLTEQRIVILSDLEAMSKEREVLRAELARIAERGGADAGRVREALTKARSRAL